MLVIKKNHLFFDLKVHNEDRSIKANCYDVRHCFLITFS